MRQRAGMNLDQNHCRLARSSFVAHCFHLGPRLGLFTCLALLVPWLAGCGNFGWGASLTGSGRLVTRQFELTGFTRVAAGSAFNVTITQGAQFSVVVTVDDNVEDYLDVSKSGDTLRLNLKSLQGGVRNVTLQAQVTMPELRGLHLDGASHTTLAGFSSDKPLEAELSGASRLRGDLKNGDARFGLSGASHVDLQGSAGDLRVSASGASRANFERYASKDSVVEVSGASHVTLNPSGKLEGEASGASHVSYLGKPEFVRVHTSGASSVSGR